MKKHLHVGKMDVGYVVVAMGGCFFNHAVVR